MKKFLIFVLLGCFFIPLSIFAEEPPSNQETSESAAQEASESAAANTAKGVVDLMANNGGLKTGTIEPVSIVGKVVGTVLGFLGVVFLILMVKAGFSWMLAGGDPQKVINAKKSIVNSVGGLIVCLSAYFLSTFIIENLINVLK